MYRRKRRLLGVALRDMVVAGAALTLMAAVVPPNLQRMRQEMQPISCANNLRVCNQAFNVYAGDFNGVWMAPWDRNIPPWAGYSYTSQWPYTMVHYVTGDHLPQGTTVYDIRDGGWYAGTGLPRHVYPPAYCLYPAEAPQLQCAEIVSKGSEINILWWGATSYSYAIIGGQRQSNGSVAYSYEYYPRPDIMTHPSTTVHMHDLGGIMFVEGPHTAWSTYPNYATDPHSGKSNYVFADGHVELLAGSETDERMWQSLWEPTPPAAAAEQTGGAQ